MEGWIWKCSVKIGNRVREVGDKMEGTIVKVKARRHSVISSTYGTANTKILNLTYSFVYTCCQQVALMFGPMGRLFNRVLYRAHVNITNTGDVAGHEAVQLYLGLPNAPEKQLRGFECMGILQPGESREVEFALNGRDLSARNVVAQKWEL
jgi:hypothetical protein